MRIIKNKRGFEFGFGWIFAIIAGAAIIFLAVYASNELIKSERQISDTEAGKQLGIILNPIETGIEEGKSSIIKFPGETRVYNECDSSGIFGEQRISIASKSGVGKDWEKPGVPSSFNNKYIFSSGVIEGRELAVFSKPFFMPYKSADALILWPLEEYCFVNPPREIKDELENMNIKGINITDDIKECKKQSKRICFTNSGCDIDVNLQSKSVKKNKQTLFYEDDSENALLYGAIFSDPGVYECQIKRLMKRAGELADLYKAKSEMLEGEGCNSNLNAELEIYSNKTKQIKDSRDLYQIQILSEEIRRENAQLSCKLF